MIIWTAAAEKSHRIDIGTGRKPPVTVCRFSESAFLKGPRPDLLVINPAGFVSAYLRSGIGTIPSLRTALRGAVRVLGPT